VIIADDRRRPRASTLGEWKDGGGQRYKEGTGGLPFRGLCGKCGAARVDAQRGLEATPDEFVAGMVEVFREVRRVLRPDGTLWLNLGDSYTDSGRGADTGSTLDGSRHNQRESRKTRVRETASTGLRPKNLVGIPWRVAFALQADAWYLRSDIVWAKPNPMPESVTDRPTKSHEYLFLLAKSERYYYDAESIMEPIAAASVERLSQPTLEQQEGSHRVPGKTNGPMKAVVRKSGNKRRDIPSADDGRGILNDHAGRSVPWEGSMRNRRSVWTVTTVPFKGAHFATFPPKLIEPCILAGAPIGGNRAGSLRPAPGQLVSSLSDWVATRFCVN
jgi:DNA modification methylase